MSLLFRDVTYHICCVGVVQSDDVMFSICLLLYFEVSILLDNSRRSMARTETDRGPRNINNHKTVTARLAHIVVLVGIPDTEVYENYHDE